MIYIKKEKEPDALIKWKKKFKNKHQRKPDYEDIKKEPEKQILKLALIAEQKYLCCYCCNRISNADSHIEHFRPQSIRQDLSLEYSNLHASCQGEKGDMKHCGHAKSDRYDETLLISPLDEACDKRFLYSGSGKIKPADANDKGAEYTIDVLALNDERLKGARCEAMWTAGVFTVKSQEERQQLMNKFSNAVNGKHTPFCNAILSQLRKDMEDIGTE